jgi:hypothetical protein
MHMKKTAVSALLAMMPLLAACGGDTESTFGIMVQIRDAQTGAQAWYDATLVTSDGAYADTIRGSLGFPPSYKDSVTWLGAARDRPGTYTVTITHPAYQPWRREGVRVRRGGGANPFDGSDVPETVTLIAELQPFPQK